MREQAAWALRRIEGRAGIPALAAALTRRDPDPDVREQAAWALGRTEDEGAVLLGRGASVPEALWAVIGVAVGLAGVAPWLSSGEEGEQRMTHPKANREAVDRTMIVGRMSVGEAPKDAPTAPSRPQGAA